jgi:hypothetical protein
LVKQLYHFLMPLQMLDRDLGVIDFPFSAGGLQLGARTTVVRFTDGPLAGALALIAPGRLTEDDALALTALGPVRALVAPNLLHHLYLAEVQARFAGAKLYAPAALSAKQPTLRIDGPPEAIAGADVHAIAVGGMPKLQETVFIHRPSRTLITTDFVFNIRAPAPWFTRTFMRFNGGFDRFGPTRIFRSIAKDRAAVRVGVERILAQDFDRVIMAHGRVLDRRGNPAMRRGFEWLLT